MARCRSYRFRRRGKDTYTMRVAARMCALLALLIGLSALLWLTGCSKAEDDSSANTKSPTPAQEINRAKSTGKVSAASGTQ